MQSSSLRRLISLFSAGALVASLAVATLPAAVLAAAPPAPYFNGFEDAEDVGATDQAMFGVSRVATGPGTITTASGVYHALAGTAPSSEFTRYGGYSSTFPVGGYTTSIDIYLDMAESTGSNDLRFDWSSAINTQAAVYTHLRDFAFNVGTDGLGGFVMSASNNTGRSGANPANPAGNPLTIATSGWYTFQHRFYDNGGVLAVDLTVRALGDPTPVRTWTLSTPTDLIGTIVGGNRYGWLVTNELPLALDNVTRTSFVPKCTPTGFERDGIDLTAAQIGGAVTGTLDAVGCNIGAYNPTSVTDATIFGANYFGVVANGVALSLTNSTIRNIGEVPFNGSQHGNAVVYINGASGTISGNTVFDYQKNGITVSGKAADGDALSPNKTSATVSNNVVTGEGPVAYIAQNGIQISYGASATVKGNTVSDNYYTPTSNTACGLLFYQADGVKSSNNNLFDNEVNFCNAGRGGGKPRP